MVRQSTKRTVVGENQPRDSQETSSGANLPSIFITRDEMETMMNGLQKRIMTREKEMMKNFLRRRRQTGTVGVAANQTQ